jgi:hypothetical protein
VKKGRHRRFEEARKLKQVGPDFLLDEPALRPPEEDVARPTTDEDDEYAEIAARYGAFDDEDEDDEEDDARP